MYPQGLLVAVICLAATSATWAQSDKKPDAAEAAAAMERAQRLAANPMRIILQASKIKRKGGGEGEPAEAAAEPATRTDAAIASRAVPAPRGLVASTAIVLTAGPLLAAPTSAPVAALQDEGPAAAMTPMPAALAPLAEVTPLITPKLAQMVEPVIPARLREQVGTGYEVLADLTIQADGSVSEVALLPPTPRLLQRQVQAALQQWRFEPLPATRVHRVQLVYSEGT
jgi:hypothetical protein